ncbi:cell death abnormality protein 1-like [Haliotis cracherodii]|uniref:cell death abnormality protein 1-like n=1 Tax=Haliotis cracherodii TaxID=6455 RepID=UPI0039E888BF
MEAVPCPENQHCSDCDSTTGHCLTECDTGYFGRTCSSVCSDKCMNKSCILVHNGIGNCTGGCVPGYQGINCNIPCDNPGGNCTACPGGCDGGYCQLGSSCVSGCVDSHYGTGCDEKSAVPCPENQHCLDCDNTTGHCLTECDTGYFGRMCSSVCSDNCMNKSCILVPHGIGNCTEGCVPGFQGRGCNIPCDSPGGNCTACPGGCYGRYCQLGSSCVSGCEDSYYGTDCKNCSSGCKTCNRMTGTCDEESAVPCPETQHFSDCDNTTGHCLTECDTGYFGQMCSSVCSHNCNNKKCILEQRGIGNCTEACVPGYQGLGCNIPCDTAGIYCTACPDGCDGGHCQLGPSCVSGCVDSYYGTDCKNCSRGCTTCNRWTGTCYNKLVKSEVMDITVNGRRRITVGDKENVTFRCKVQGYLLPNVSIIHEGHNAPAVDMIKKKISSNSISIISGCSILAAAFIAIALIIRSRLEQIRGLGIMQIYPRIQDTWAQLKTQGRSLTEEYESFCVNGIMRMVDVDMPATVRQPANQELQALHMIATFDWSTYVIAMPQLRRLQDASLVSGGHRTRLSGPIFAKLDSDPEDQLSFLFCNRSIDSDACIGAVPYSLGIRETGDECGFAMNHDFFQVS